MMRPLFATLFVILAISSCPEVQAQSPPPTVSVPSAGPTTPPIPWEVISIHPHDPNDANTRWGDVPNGFSMVGVDLRTLLTEAYAFAEPKLRDDELIGLPDWAKSKRYDVLAHVSADDVEAYKKMRDITVEEDVRHMMNHEPLPDMVMMRSLLEQRFGLKVHYETRIRPVYNLVLDKGGAKLKPAADLAHGSASWNAGVVKGQGVPTQFMAMMLSMAVDRNVLDQTGVPGRFDFELHYLPDNTPPAPTNNDPSIFTAVREQLGMRLEPAKAPVFIVVVDAIHEPTPN